MAEEAKEALLRELAENGFPVTSVWDLFNQKHNYRPIVPLLIKWLPRIDDDRLKEGVVRALSVKWAKPSAASLLVEEFVKSSDPSELGLRWTIGNALSVVADDSVFDALVRLVQDRKYGRSREMVAVALGNMKDARTDTVLLDLLDDEEVAGHALMALGKRRSKKAREKIETFLDHPKTWVRKEARKALKRIK